MFFVLAQMGDGDHMGRGSWWVSRADEVLDERFARGEIDEDEYRRRRDALRN